MPNAADIAKAPAQVALDNGRSGGVLLGVNAVFGASGAVSSYSGSYGCSVDKPSGTGLYRVLVPNAKAVYVVSINYFDAGGGGDYTVLYKTKAPTTGIIEFTLNSAGVAANATSGDSLDAVVLAEF